MKKKYGGKTALYLVQTGKIVHVGGFSTQQKYKQVVEKLLKKYPSAKEEDFGITYIPGNWAYIMPLIGRAGFFETFKITFDELGKRVILNSYS